MITFKDYVCRPCVLSLEQPLALLAELPAWATPYEGFHELIFLIKIVLHGFLFSA